MMLTANTTSPTTTTIPVPIRCLYFGHNPTILETQNAQLEFGHSLYWRKRRQVMERVLSEDVDFWFKTTISRSRGKRGNVLVFEGWTPTIGLLYFVSLRKRGTVIGRFRKNAADDFETYGTVIGTDVWIKSERNAHRVADTETSFFHEALGNMLFSNDRELQLNHMHDYAWFSIGDAPEGEDGRRNPQIGHGDCSKSMHWRGQTCAIFGISMQFDEPPSSPPELVISTFGDSLAEDVLIPYTMMEDTLYILPFTLEQPLLVDHACMRWMREVTRVKGVGRVTLRWSAISLSYDARDRLATRAEHGGLVVRPTLDMQLRYRGGVVSKIHEAVEGVASPLFTTAAG